MKYSKDEVKQYVKEDDVKFIRLAFCDVFGTYAVLDKYIRTGICEDSAIKEKIDKMYAANRFKLEPIPHFVPNF